MRKSNGFTLIELLAVMIILGLLIVLVIPGYTSVYSSIKRQNYHSKLNEVNVAAQKYGSKIKDEVKDSPGSCQTITIDDLIKEGLMISEEDRRNVIYNPTTNQPLDGKIEICYCKSTFDIQSFYSEDFKDGTVYHQGDYVRYQDKIYKCLIDTTGKQKPNDSSKDSRGNSYFEELSC